MCKDLDGLRPGSKTSLGCKIVIGARRDGESIRCPSDELWLEPSLDEHACSRPNERYKRYLGFIHYAVSTAHSSRGSGKFYNIYKWTQPIHNRWIRWLGSLLWSTESLNFHHNLSTCLPSSLGNLKSSQSVPACPNPRKLLRRRDYWHQKLLDTAA